MLAGALRPPARLPLGHGTPRYCATAGPPSRNAVTTAPPPPAARRRASRCRAAGASGSAEPPPAYLERVAEAADRGDLAGLQAALEELQDPAAEIDALLAWGGGVPQAPFHRAAAAGREMCLKVLMLGGADRDLPDGAGRTAMHLAAAAGQEECVEVLLSGGVAITTDDEGRTPLHAAASGGHQRCVQQLASSRRVAVDAADGSGRTALHLAAAAPQCSVPCVRALLAAGASTAAVDGGGATPRKRAAAAGNTAAELYLLAVESTARALPGRPTRSELLADEDGELAGVYRLACQLEGAGGAEGQEGAAGALRAAVRGLVERQGQAGFFFGQAG